MKQLIIGGITIDMTHVIMNDKYETLEVEFEWDMKKTLQVLDYQQQQEISSEELKKFIGDIKIALFEYGVKPQEGETTQQRDQASMLKLRTEFLKYGVYCLVRSSVGLAMSLKGEVGVSNIRGRD